MSAVGEVNNKNDVKSDPVTAASPEPINHKKDEQKPATAITESTERQISTKEAYFASLNEWVKHANISQNAMALFPWYLLSSYPQLFHNQPGMNFLGQNATSAPVNTQVPGNATTNLNGTDGNPLVGRGRAMFQYPILGEQLQAELIQNTGGYEYIIAPFWKRVVAEIIDMVILLLLKIIVTFTVMNLFDLDLGFDLDKEVLRKAIDDDDYAGFLAVSMDFLAFSSDLLMLEILTKIIVCFYEAIWTAAYNGATPGKVAMKLRIQYVEAVYPLQPPVEIQPLARQFQGFQVQRTPIRALIFPAEIPTFQRAFMRAVAKNLIMTLFFPMYFIMIFFKNNRTAYDIITKTIVVEANPNPVLRRPTP